MDEGAKISLEVTGLKELVGQIDGLKAYLASTQVVFAKAATVVTASVQRNFKVGGRPQKWPDLSLISYFIRSHRSRKKNTDAKTLVDTGRLMGSVVPHFTSSSEGGTFGAKTNVSYAKILNDGGTSVASEVVIGAFTRRKPSGGTSRVRSYVMHMKGGHKVPARPFMVLQSSDKPVLNSIFREWLQGFQYGKHS